MAVVELVSLPAPHRANAGSAPSLKVTQGGGGDGGVSPECLPGAAVISVGALRPDWTACPSGGALVYPLRACGTGAAVCPGDVPLGQTSGSKLLPPSPCARLNAGSLHTQEYTFSRPWSHALFCA